MKYLFSGKAKGIFFIKKDEVQIPKENFADLLISGDLSQIPLEHLSDLVEDIFNDVFSHNDNAGSWPTVVTGDVNSNVHRLKSEVYEVSGSVKGKNQGNSNHKFVNFQIKHMIPKI